MPKFLPACLIALALMIASCGGKTPTVGEITNAIITCTESACTAQPAGPTCSKLEGDVMSCFTSGGNVATCLAGIPDLAAVGYADVACIVSDLALPPDQPRPASAKLAASPAVQLKAAAWLKTQRITVQK
jgi:hypothetical protein